MPGWRFLRLAMRFLWLAGDLYAWQEISMPGYSFPSVSLYLLAVSAVKEGGGFQNLKIIRQKFFNIEK